MNEMINEIHEFYRYDMPILLTIDSINLNTNEVPRFACKLSYWPIVFNLI